MRIVKRHSANERKLTDKVVKRQPENVPSAQIQVIGIMRRIGSNYNKLKKKHKMGSNTDTFYV